MFMIRNVSKYLFGDSSKESIIEIPQGQLYLVRPLSVKGFSELIFKDGAATIRRTGQDFQYQLVIQRAYEEGEEELEEEEGEEGLGGLGSEKDEKTFLLDESIRFRVDVRSTGEKVLAWDDLSGDKGDLFEFVCDTSTQPETVSQFAVVAAQCQYERKFRKGFDTASAADLEQFTFDEEPIPTASPVLSPVESRSPAISPSPSQRVLDSPANMARANTSAPSKTDHGKQTVPPPSRGHPVERDVLAKETAELHLFDFDSSTFIIQDPQVTATVSEFGDWRYWLQIASKDRNWLGQEITSDINPVFNFEYLSFIFNHYEDDGSAYSWLLRFKDQSAVERFQQGIMRAQWEQQNKIKWAKLKDNDQDYIAEAFQDLTMEDAPAEEEEDGEGEEEEESEEEDDARPREEHYDTDESEDDVVLRDEDGNINSQLAVGYKHDRSFVVRGSKIGVFKHTPDNHLEFTTNISKVQTPKGKLFSPTKVMLHTEDRDMILQNQDNPNSLYRMDLEYGTIVDEWKVHDDVPVTSFAPENKFAQMTSEQTFLGLSDNSLFRIDPRLAGQKLVESQHQSYASKVGFTGAATTEQGYVAVASSKGDIRMFDRLGIRAKSQLPALGDPIIGIDVSKEGRWVLATTKTYLLLVDVQAHGGKNDGKLGFEKGVFGKDNKPQPKRLALTPPHVAQFMAETKTQISFTPAHFNTGVGKDETTIVTATGPFIVTWSMKKVLANQKEPYSIKRYSDEVKADNFRFGSDKSLIVALPNEVDMVARRALKRPTRESIAGEGLRTPRRSGAGRLSGLRKSDVVNSPY